MKVAAKGIGMMFVGLFVAVILYPLLHEGSHSLAATAFGADVIEFRLFPLPSVLCNIAGLSDTAIAMVGMSGMVFPMLLSIFFNPKPFWLWYGNTLIRGISILALVITIIATILYCLGRPLANEDITSVLRIFHMVPVVLIVSLCLMIILIVRIMADKPVKKLIAYFDM